MERTFRVRGLELNVRIPDRLLPRRRRETAQPHALKLTGTRDLRLVDRSQAVSEFERANRELREHDENRPPLDEGTIAERAARINWYHTIDLGNGVVTGGLFDHRTLVPHYGLPDSLAGQRVIDVGTWDGFWAFELERRGGDVTAFDLPSLGRVDLPAAQRESWDRQGFDHRLGEGFELAHHALGSKVRYTTGSVYDLDPAEMGTFDLVHFSDVTLHLERPTTALRRIRGITGGRAHIVHTFDPSLHGHTVRYLGGFDNATWWIPSLDAAGQMTLDAGFSDVRLHQTYRLTPAGGGLGWWRAIFIATP